jgi:hypothetical protein
LFPFVLTWYVNQLLNYGVNSVIPKPICIILPLRPLPNAVLDWLEAFDDPYDAFCKRGGLFFPFVLTWCVNQLHNYGVILVILQPIGIILSLSPLVYFNLRLVGSLG